MTVEYNIRCDDCNKELAEGDECYCGKCVQDWKDLIDSQGSEIDDLKQENSGLEEEIGILQDKIAELEKGGK